MITTSKMHSDYMYQIRSRNSQSSDTSSAYSGSDTMASVHSVEPEEVDLSGLVESIVDSDEDDICENNESLSVRDTVRECLEKDPFDRTEDDIDVLLEFTQHLKAFTNMTHSIRRALCSVMVFAVVEKAGTVVMNDGEELDSWSVLINGHVEIEHTNGKREQLHLGDSFGILPTMEKLYHDGVMRTKCDDCQFVCITQTDYYRIQHQGEENIRKHENSEGRVVMITEQRGNLETGRRGFVVIRALPEQLISQLVEDNSVVDPTYVEDFLLTFRTFLKEPLYLINQLMDWFSDIELRDRVTRVILLWVNNHFADFDTDSVMMEFLESFETCLETEGLTGQLQLLNIVYTAKSQPRSVILTRPDRDYPLCFQIVGGYEHGCGIYISSVDRGSKAAEIGLKRGDQILTVNGFNFEHISYNRAIEILRGSTHLGISVKANLVTLKNILRALGNQPIFRVGRVKQDCTKINAGVSSVGPVLHSVSLHSTPMKSPCPKSSGGFMTLGPKKKLQRALMKMNILSKYTITDSVDDSSIVHRGHKESSSSSSSSSLYQHSHSQPDLISMSYDDTQNDVPEHVLKVYKCDQMFKYLLIHKETTAHEVVMLALQEFGMTEPSSQFCLCEVTIAEGGIIKQKRLPDQLQNLAERIDLSSRYYLKMNSSTEPLVNDELAADIAKENSVFFLQLNAVELAVQLTLKDYDIFKKIESTEYIDDLFNLQSKYGSPALSQFSELVNKEMFWVVTEICSELNLVRRSKIVKQFVKIARHCKECKNFNSMFAILSGLGHGSVSRLRQTWDKLPTKYQKLFNDLQDLMDPSRNMSKYRQLVASEQANPPVIPFYPVVKKDLTFINLGNDTTVDGLINFEKLRMISKEIRTLMNMCSTTYDIFSMAEHSAQIQLSTMSHFNATVTNNIAGISTVKRRKKSVGVLNPKKMFEESQMIRRVRAYLNRMKVIHDEDKLHELSQLCEGGSLSIAPGSGQLKKRHPSPTLSTASNASSTSEGRKTATAPKFGSASPQAVRKLLSLSEQSKTRPYHPKHLVSSPGSHLHLPTLGIPSTPILPTSHERSHSDTTGGSHLYYPSQFLSVDLNAESSSVTSLSNLPLRKTVTSGSITSSDSGHSTQLDTYSNNSLSTR